MLAMTTDLRLNRYAVSEKFPAALSMIAHRLIKYAGAEVMCRRYQALLPLLITELKSVHLWKATCRRSLARSLTALLIRRRTCTYGISCTLRDSSDDRRCKITIRRQWVYAAYRPHTDILLALYDWLMTSNICSLTMVTNHNHSLKHARFSANFSRF